MRDITHRRRRLDGLRAELDAIWLAADIDVSRWRAIIVEMRRLARSEMRWGKSRTEPSLGDNFALAIQVAATTAAKLVGCDAKDVFANYKCKLSAITQARVYAVLALMVVFPNSGQRLAKAVGCMENMPWNMRSRHKHGLYLWFDERQYRKVLAAVASVGGR